MAKITRKNQQIFAGVVAPTNVVAQFGSFKAGSIAYSSDPDVIQALAAWGAGFSSAVVTNDAPCIQDFNALFFLVTRQIAYIMQQGISEYNSTTPYFIGSIVSDGVGGLYQSVSDTNVGVALTDATKWKNYYSKKITDVDADYTVLNADWYIRFTDTVASGEKVTLPTPASTNVGREIIVKLTGPSYISQLKIDVTGGSTIEGDAAIYISQYASKRLICDGTNWNVV